MIEKPYPADKARGGENHPEYTGAPRHLFVRFDRRGCSGAYPGDGSLTKLRFPLQLL